MSARAPEESLKFPKGHPGTPLFRLGNNFLGVAARDVLIATEAWNVSISQFPEAARITKGEIAIPERGVDSIRIRPPKSKSVFNLFGFFEPGDGDSPLDATRRRFHELGH